jgi:hypothetical protein
MGSGHANLGVGSLVRVGPNELVTDDPEVLRKMMAVRSVCVRRHENKTDLARYDLRIREVIVRRPMDVCLLERRKTSDV